jgi:hypothetical protein
MFMATSTIAADASAGARGADVDAAFLDGAGELAGAYPSDEAILGIDDGGGNGSVAPGLSPASLLRRSASDARDAAREIGGRTRAGLKPGATQDEFGEALLPGGENPRGTQTATRFASPQATRVAQGATARAVKRDGDPEVLARRGADGSAANAQGGAPPMPEWLAQLGAASAPEASAELDTLWQRATALDAFDRAYYGDDAGAQQQLVSELYAANPGALRAMFAAAANVLHGGGNGRGAGQYSDVILSGGTRGSAARSEESVDANRRGGRRDGVGSADAGRSHRSFVAQGAPQDDNQIMGGAVGGAENGSVAQGLGPAVFPRRGVSGAAGDGFRGAMPMGGAENIGGERPQGQGPALHNPAAAHFDAGAYAHFERATNDAVVSDVTRAIERMLDRALPEGIADGARRRIAGDTLNEVHTALRGDRQLSAQVAETLRGGRFDDAAREQVARLIANRARGVVPAAAKHVIGEWTGSVLSTHRERSAKQRSTQSRVDITGGGLPQSVPRRVVRPADVDYRATTDDEILSW